MGDRFDVVVGAGSCRSAAGRAVRFPHRWTPEGVTVEADFTGGHLLHLAAAGCVLNDVYREAAILGIELTGVRVSAAGGFDPDSWESTGIDYAVEVRSSAPVERLGHLLDVVDAVAEIPRALRSGAPVQRIS
jgi:OsmC-like protein